MGKLSDQFKRDLAEMRARHAETDRELERARDAVFAALAEIQAIARDMEEV